MHARVLRRRGRWSIGERCLAAGVWDVGEGAQPCTERGSKSRSREAVCRMYAFRIARSVMSRVVGCPNGEALQGIDSCEGVARTEGRKYLDHGSEHCATKLVSSVCVRAGVEVADCRRAREVGCQIGLFYVSTLPTSRSTPCVRARKDVARTLLRSAPGFGVTWRTRCEFRSRRHARLHTQCGLPRLASFIFLPLLTFSSSTSIVDSPARPSRPVPPAPWRQTGARDLRARCESCCSGVCTPAVKRPPITA
ncbi:hypothetical protein K438DRAFT_411892 [Mycena galopus ATCC 62051]|nr:hypothetical protein K438DRAFT_411892 [Mycena galopus ATCC 62051]